MSEQNSSRIFRNLIRQALINLGAQVAIYDKNFSLLWSNDYYRDVFGESCDSIVRTCLDHFHEDESCLQYLIRKTFSTKSIQQAVFKIESQSEETRFFKSLTFPMYEKKDVFSNVIEISWDITEKTAYQTLLSGQNSLLQSLANSSLDAILVLNNKNNITFWNIGAEKMLGYTFEDVLNQDLRYFFPDDQTAEREYALMHQLLHIQGYIKNFETQLKTKDGQTLRVEITFAFINPERREQEGSYLVIRDISTRKNLEYIFRQTIDQLSKLHEIANLLHRLKSEDDIFQCMLVSVTAGEGLRFNRAFLLTINFENQMLEGKFAIGPADPEEASLIWQQVPQQFHSLEEILNSIKDNGLIYNTKVMDIAKALSVSLGDNSNLLIQAINNRTSYLVQSIMIHLRSFR